MVEDAARVKSNKAREGIFFTIVKLHNQQRSNFSKEGILIFTTMLI